MLSIGNYLIKSTYQDDITEAEDCLISYEHTNKDANLDAITERMKALQKICDPIVATLKATRVVRRIFLILLFLYLIQ